MTGSLARVLKPTNPQLTLADEMLETVIFYDNRGRVIQTITETVLGGQEVVSHAYFTDDITERIYKTHIRQVGSQTGTHTLEKRYEYDHAGRVTAVYNSVGGGAEQQRAAYEYDELGRQTEKNLHELSGGTFAQSVDYEYNIRGWLTGINDPENLDDPTEDFDDFFGMKLGYGDPSFMPSLFNENGESSMFATYNGNISAVASKTAGQSAVGFVYDYDGMSRLTTAFLNSGTTMLPATNMMTYSYDKNGNIQTLTRKNSTLFDNLSYRYYTGTNQLKNVHDATNNVEGYCCGTTATGTMHLRIRYQWQYDCGCLS